MWYPQNGSMAMGSRRVTPTAPVAAAVVSDAIVAPTYTPCCQLNDSYTSGATRARRPPKINAEIGTPSGSSQRGEIDGAWWAGTVYRELACAGGSCSSAPVQPCQSTRPAGAASSRPCHHGSRDAVIAVLVKIELLRIASITFPFVFRLVPGATPKKPASGLIACR